MPVQNHSTETKRRLLEAARLEFSRKGFRAATIAAICRMAGANIASVNYHFGDKKTLYVEAWREAFRHAHDLYPADGGVAPNAPAKERLRGWIVSFLGRITDPACCDFEMLHREMTDPTGYLSQAMQEAIEPMREGLAVILLEVLGGQATQEELELCEMSVRTQCMNPMIFRMRHDEPPANFPIPPPPALHADVQTVAAHVVRFCLAGLDGVRKRLQEQKTPGKPRGGPKRPARPSPRDSRKGD